jgi:hypothetical protein
MLSAYKPYYYQVEKLIANSMDPDQTVQICWLVWIYAGRKRIMLVLSYHIYQEWVMEGKTKDFFKDGLI